MVWYVWSNDICKCVIPHICILSNSRSSMLFNAIGGGITFQWNIIIKTPNPFLLSSTVQSPETFYSMKPRSISFHENQKQWTKREHIHLMWSLTENVRFFFQKYFLILRSSALDRDLFSSNFGILTHHFWMWSQ